MSVVTAMKKRRAASWIIPAGLLLGVSSIASRLLGLLRDRIIAGEFGAGIETDAYFSAFRIPDTLFSLLVLGALSSAVVPVITDYIAKKETAQAHLVVQTLFTGTAAVLTVLAVAAAIAAPVAELVQAHTTGRPRWGGRWPAGAPAVGGCGRSGVRAAAVWCRPWGRGPGFATA